MTDFQIPNEAMSSNAVYPFRREIVDVVAVVVCGVMVKCLMSSDVMSIGHRRYIAFSVSLSALVSS